MNDRRYPVAARTADYHTAGEPFRIVVDGVAPPPGVTVADRRLAAIRGEDGGVADRARRLLCHEPRGHDGMYGGFVVPADPVPPGSPRAAFGVLFWHRDGFSTACGHGTIALATWAADDGLADVPWDGDGTFAIDVPSGRVGVTVHRQAGAVTAVTMANVPAWVTAEKVTVPTSVGALTVAVSFGGAFYASARAADAGLSVQAADLPRLITLAAEIRSWFGRDPGARAAVTHLQDPRLSGLYGTIWYEDASPSAGDAGAGDRLCQRNVTVFADGQVDRSPCGSGTSARLALLDRQRAIQPGQVLRHLGITGTAFDAWLGERTPSGVVTFIRGSAYRTGQHTFVADPADPLRGGFVI